MHFSTSSLRCFKKHSSWLLFLFFIIASCKSRTSELKGDVKLKQSPEKVMFHFGPFGDWIGYGKRAGTFSDEEWKKIGSVARPYGGEYRSGLYISQHTAINEPYGESSLKSGNQSTPWIVSIHLKQECLDSSLEKKRWSNLYLDIPDDDCNPFDYEKGSAPSAQCQRAILKHYRNRNIGIVTDHWWDSFGFWYIRKPDCIETIDASPAGVIKAMATLPEFWSMRPYTSRLSRGMAGNSQFSPGIVSLFVLVKAIEQLDFSLVDSQDQFNQVFETAKKTDIAEIKTGLVALTEKFAICSKEKRYQVQLKSEMTKLLSVFSSPTPPSNEKLLGVIQSLPTTLAKTCTATSGSDQVSNIQDQPKTKKNDTESPSFNANQKFNVDAKQGEGKPLVINFLLTDKNYEFESISLNGNNVKILSPQATNIPVLLSNPQEVIRIAGKIKGVKGSFSTSFIMRRGDAFTVRFSPQS